MKNTNSPFFKIETTNVVEKSKFNYGKVVSWLQMQQEKKQLYFKAITNKRKIFGLISKYKELDKYDTWFRHASDYKKDSIYFHGIGSNKSITIRWGNCKKNFKKIYDPAKYEFLSEDIELSPNKRYIVLQFQYKESDLTALYVLDLKTGKRVNIPYEHLYSTSNIVWTKDNELLFSTMYQTKDIAKYRQTIYKYNLLSKTLKKIFSIDKMVAIYIHSIKDSYDYLFEVYDTFNFSLYRKNIKKNEKAVLIKEFKQCKVKLFDFDGDNIYYTHSSFKVNNGDVKTFNINNFIDKTIIFETKKVIQDVRKFSKYIAVSYVDEKMFSYIYIYDLNGCIVKKKKINEYAEVSLSGDTDDQECLIVKASTLERKDYYSYKFDSNKFELYRSKPTKLDGLINIELKKYKSFDGEIISYYQVRHNKTKINKETPTLLVGYGGFSTNNIPYYETGIAALLELGCVIIYPGIRGGGEKGFKWSKAGSVYNKMTTVKDFIECAKFLIRNKKTNKNKLVSLGISHGGFVVSSALNIAPELFKACVPVVGLMDISNYEKNRLIADNWIKDFGVKSNYKQNLALKKVCPLNNADTFRNEPAIFAVAGTHDSRVLPEQIYKYINKMELLNIHYSDKIILENVKNKGHFCHDNLSVKRKIVSFIVNELEIL